MILQSGSDVIEIPLEVDDNRRDNNPSCPPLGVRGGIERQEKIEHASVKSSPLR